MAQGCAVEPAPPLITAAEHARNFADPPRWQSERQARAHFENAGQRLALIIGISDYGAVGAGPFKSLTTPIEDARAVARELRNRGFETILCEDPTGGDLSEGVAQAFRRIEDGAEMFLWYSGHGSRDGKLIGRDLDGLPLENILHKLEARAAELGAEGGGFRFFGVLVGCHTGDALARFRAAPEREQSLARFDGSAYFMSAATGDDRSEGLFVDDGLIRVAFLRVLRRLDGGAEERRGRIPAYQMADQVEAELAGRFGNPIQIGRGFVPLRSHLTPQDHQVFHFAHPTRLDWAVGAPFRPCTECPTVRIAELAEADSGEIVALSDLIRLTDWDACEDASACKRVGDVAETSRIMQVSHREAERYLDYLNAQVGDLGAFSLPSEIDYKRFVEADWRLLQGKADCVPDRIWQTRPPKPILEAAEAGIYPMNSDHLQGCMKRLLSDAQRSLEINPDVWEWLATCHIVNENPCRRAKIVRLRSDGGSVDRVIDREWTSRATPMTDAREPVGFRVVFRYQPATPASGPGN
ncbi:caspase family protein [Sedimentitalea xiamensis]|nr:caspase family protein [Sedimentitalea xiamensis]